MKRKLSETVTIEEHQNESSDNQEDEEETEVMEVEDQPKTKTRQENPPKKLKPFDVKVFRKSFKGTDFIFGECIKYSFYL